MTARSQTKKPLWICPHCGNKFVTKNMWHSCGIYSPEHHFENKPPILMEIYEKYRKMMESIGPIIVTYQKTRIVFQTRMRFAGLVVRKSYIIGNIVLKKRFDDKRFFKIENLLGKYFIHYFKISTPNELDNGFMRYFKKAYKIGDQDY